MMLPVHSKMLVLLGELSTSFSNLEFLMSSILAKLIDTSAESIAGSFVVDDFNMHRTTSLIRKLARYRFAHDDRTLEELTVLCSSVDEVRPQRNLFVHGMWNLDPAVLAQGMISVFDMKWKEDKKSKHWSRMHEQVFVKADLTALRNQIRLLVHKALELNNRITPAEMMPHWQPNRTAEQPHSSDSDKAAQGGPTGAPDA